MKRFGEGVAKKPLVPFALLIMITVASLGIIAMDPPSFDMDEESFTPDNEFTRANSTIIETFATTAMVTSLLDAGSGGDIFTKESFLNILGYERQLAMMEYTSAATGTDGNPYHSDTGAFMIVSPVSSIVEAFAENTLGMPIPDMRSDPDAYYGTLIGVVSDPSFEPLLKMAAYGVLSDPAGAALASMITSDLVKTEIAPGVGTASARGCMVSVVILDGDLAMIDKGQLGFEGDVIDAAKGFSSAGTVNISIRVAGMETMTDAIGDLAMNDISKLLVIAIIVIIVLLLAIYRDISDTLICLLGLLIAIVWTFGVSTLLGIQMSTIAIAVPILILALGIDYSLHLVFRYREERMSGQDPLGAIARTMGSVGQALVLATVTTAIAFLSYLTSEMSALADFGLMCAIGIVCAFGSMMLLVPTMQTRRDRKMEKKGRTMEDTRRYRRSESPNGDAVSKVSAIGGRIAAKRPLAVIGIVAVLMVGFGVSATNLSYDFDMYEFIPEGTDASATLTYLNENYTSSTSTTSVLIYGSGWDIEVIQAIENSLDNMSDPVIQGLQYPVTGDPPQAEYIGTELRELDGTLERMAAADPADTAKQMAYAYYHGLYTSVFDAGTGRLLPITGPIDAAVKQALLDEIKALVGSGPELSAAVASVVGEYDGKNITRIILSMDAFTEDGNDAAITMRDMINEACTPLDAAGFEHTTTGQDIIMSYSLKTMNDSQMTALFITIAFVVIVLTMFMYVADRSWLLGVMATVPTLMSVVMVWGTMAMLDIPMNVMTLTIASLAVGMGVTYGIHISHRYAMELRNSSPEEAIKTATRETGRGVFAAAITTIAGFGVMVFSKILPMFQFGVITALAIGFGYLGSIFLLPSMLVIWGRHVKKREGQPKRERPKWDEYSMRMD
ncbi:MAG: MMPL family transporter [Methanomassiliicoccaceae archaeon]|nr:MMPL family transporter [Methanomassiliicoccaceae archaeon]